jgi:hypothetical protein
MAKTRANVDYTCRQWRVNVQDRPPEEVNVYFARFLLGYIEPESKELRQCAEQKPNLFKALIARCRKVIADQEVKEGRRTEADLIESMQDVKVTEHDEQPMDITPVVAIKSTPRRIRSPARAETQTRGETSGEATQLSTSSSSTDPVLSDLNDAINKSSHNKNETDVDMGEGDNLQLEVISISDTDSKIMDFESPEMVGDETTVSGLPCGSLTVTPTPLHVGETDTDMPIVDLDKVKAEKEHSYSRASRSRQRHVRSTDTSTSPPRESDEPPKKKNEKKALKNQEKKKKKKAEKDKARIL